MNPADLLTLHRRWCQGCDSCQHAAESAKADREEPLDVGEESARADTYERWFDGPGGI